ncbi:MAG: hypothetical protein R3E95_22275 [Thiolinea sp.]
MPRQKPDKAAQAAEDSAAKAAEMQSERAAKEVVKPRKQLARL